MSSLIASRLYRRSIHKHGQSCSSKTAAPSIAEVHLGRVLPHRPAVCLQPSKFHVPWSLGLQPKKANEFNFTMAYSSIPLPHKHMSHLEDVSRPLQRPWCEKPRISPWISCGGHVLELDARLLSRDSLDSRVHIHRHMSKAGRDMQSHG